MLAVANIYRYDDLSMHHPWCTTGLKDPKYSTKPTKIQEIEKRTCLKTNKRKIGSFQEGLVIAVRLNFVTATLPGS